ncbi:MAG: glycoside hydrolase family 127 protein [Candidatus Hydrogenedentes bacterium]|nr:glycoside hydrolase family 127 protein [Candidatus Hydrogenedentota bacterium]
MRAAYSCFVLVAIVGLLSAAGHAQNTVTEAGELRARIDLVTSRMLEGGEPRFTPDFVLADVELRPDYPRRFSNYSGDLSGRVIGAFSEVPLEKSSPYVDGLVSEALKHQKTDGRFGAESLPFEPSAIGSEHMALLWGNGRLLVGFMEYYAHKSDPSVLVASKRLGDFLLAAVAACSNEEVKNRVLGLGASGMICFSQLNEGLVMLANTTGDSRYLDACKSIQTWFPAERGKQHSHGYLTTLRGLVMQYEASRDSALLETVEKLYESLVTSPELMVYGGVKEFFGDPNYECDEGCSEADFLRLGLQLWRITGKAGYLNRAEHILYNQFYANQYATGDFGHHFYSAKGITRKGGHGRAWWCCTMHGMRAFRDVLDAVVTCDSNRVRVNLIDSVQWTNDEFGITTTADRSSKNGVLRIRVDKAPEKGVPISIRVPDWMLGESVASGGQPLKSGKEDGYLVLDKSLRAGETAELSFEYKLQFLMRDGTVADVSQLTAEPTEAMVQYGPWLLGIDEHFNPLFYSEPMSDNVVTIPAAPRLDESRIGSALAVNAAHLQCNYVHGGYPDVQQVTLRPVSERTLHAPQEFMTWLRIRAER